MLWITLVQLANSNKIQKLHQIKKKIKKNVETNERCVSHI